MESDKSDMEFLRAIQKKKILESFDKGSNITDACEAAGIARSTFYVWINEDEKFFTEVINNKQIAIKMMESAIFKTGIRGDVQAQKFWLCNMSPDTWKNIRNHNLSGSIELISAQQILADLAGMKAATKNEHAGD